MEKIIFQHTDNERAAHEALRQKLQADMEAFEEKGGKRQTIPFGATSDPQARKVTGISTGDVSRQVAARTNTKHGGRMTAKQREVMDALQELAKIPGIRLSRQGLKNKMRLQLNVINDRLKLLQAKGYLRVVGDKILLNGSES